jgi:hypothetical protein
MDIQGLVTRILERLGCLVETTVDNAVQILFLKKLQETLSVGEMETFTFQAEKEIITKVTSSIPSDLWSLQGDYLRQYHFPI